MAFSEKIKELRTNAEISQQYLAEVLGVTKRTIIKYEMGQCLPSAEYLPKMAKYFGVSIDELLTEQEEFVSQAYEIGGSKGAKEASALVEGVIGLFAGGKISANDKEAAMRAISNAYWQATEDSKKFAPKKFRKEVTEDGGE